MRCAMSHAGVLLCLSFGVAFGAEPELIFPDLPEEFSVFAIGTYRGTRAVNAELDESGHAVTQVEVIVNKPGQPVVLVLTANDPVVWRVGIARDSRVVGILVSGYHGQALIGPAKEVPHAISSYSTKGKFEYFYATGASKALLSMNEAVKKLVGREIDRFENKATNGVFYIGEPPANPDDISYSDDLQLKSFAKPEKNADGGDRLPAGEKGLAILVKEGKLRLAKNKDINAWIDKASEKYARFNPELRVETYMEVGRTYVVLVELSLPDGMYGAHSASFIIPLDVPFPTGPECHNSFYHMDGTVSGSAAHAEE